MAQLRAEATPLAFRAHRGVALCHRAYHEASHHTGLVGPMKTRICLTAGALVAGVSCGGHDEDGSRGSTDTSSSASALIPAGCGFLREPIRESYWCGDHAERCEQMQGDGNTRTFECLIGEYRFDQAADRLVRLTDAARDNRVRCVSEWFEALGARNVTSGVDPAHYQQIVVRARGTWEQVGPLAGVHDLVCHPVCGKNDCDYCYDLDEANCEADVFCMTQHGRRLDLDAMCEEPMEFLTCAGPLSCDDGDAMALDGMGQCWRLQACNLDGFDYSPGDTCPWDLTECGTGRASDAP